MRRTAVSLILIAAAASTVLAQTPAADLAKPPATARHFAIQAIGGKHGDSWMWMAANGNRMGRESMNLRGQVFDVDSEAKAGVDGMPSMVAIHGVTPSGDAGETFTVNALFPQSFRAEPFPATPSFRESSRAPAAASRPAAIAQNPQRPQARPASTEPIAAVKSQPQPRRTPAKNHDIRAHQFIEDLKFITPLGDAISAASRWYRSRCQLRCSRGCKPLIPGAASSVALEVLPPCLGKTGDNIAGATSASSSSLAARPAMETPLPGCGMGIPRSLGSSSYKDTRVSSN